MSFRGANGLYVARKLGLVSGLKLVLDAGDAASYSSGQSWLDLAGSGYDFFLGATSGSEASDPTFNGTAGRLSSGEYFSHDAGDYFKYDSANEIWMQEIHKDNAVFASAAWVYPGTGAGAIFGTSGSSATSNTGIIYFYNASNGNLVIQVTNGSGTALAMSHAAGVGVTSGAWQFLATGFDEAAGTRYSYRNASLVSASGLSYSSPATGNASQTMEIAASGGAQNIVGNAARFALVSVWQGVIPSAAGMAKFFDATRGRFGV